MTPQGIVSEMFGHVTWADADRGFMQCPGKHLHTNKDAPRDCKVYLDKAPTITCFHSSCKAIVEDANYKMRRALWEQKPGEKRVMTLEEKVLIRQQIEARKQDEKLVAWAEERKEKIFTKYEWPIADVFHESPIMTESPEEDWKLLFSLYQPDDVLWSGETTDSGGNWAKDHFKKASQWLQDGPKGRFICPGVLREGVYSRSNANVIRRPYIVIESDELTLDQTCAIFKWMRGFMKMAAVVFTGGKSVHGWFQFPSDEIFKRLEIILPTWKCDSSLFTASQPVRLPGVMRGDKWQSLYWFNNL